MSKQTQKLIEQARDKWIQRLTDLSRRNNLLYYRALNTGTLELIDVNHKLFNALLQGKSVVITDLFPKKDNQINPEIIKQINAIYKRSISNLEERGLRTLFLAYGMVTWTANDGGRSPQAPLILIPISVEKKGEIKLSRYGEAEINPVLLYFLEKEHGYQITPEQLLNGESNMAEDEIPNIKNIADQLTEIVKNISDFSINQSSAILSNFAFQKMSMVRDLRDNLTALLNNKLILALAGDVSAQQSVKGDSTNIDLRKLDEINPDDEFLVFDADSSQQTVIDSALKGYNGVIQGPPGTGKSQTIANLIVTLSAQGKRVLFVSDEDLIRETRQAVEQLKRWRNLVTHTPFPEKINLSDNTNYQLKQLVLSQEFWNVFLTIRQLRYAPINSMSEVIEEIQEADTILKQWRLLCGSNLLPQSIIPDQELKDNVNQLLHDLSIIQNELNNVNLNQLSFTDLENLFQKLNSDSETPFLLARVREIEQQLNNCGAIDILAELKNIKSQPSLWSKQFRYSWLYSCLEKAYIEEPLLRTFHGQNQDQIIAEFRELDQERLEIAQLRVARNYAEKAISIMNQYPEAESLVRREANKKSRHLPLRKLLAKAPHVLTSLRPCWMASPLSVSQLLDAESYFDVVIFDEASQILPEDALPALMRAKKVIVAGDRYQLPPTNFFTINADEAEETEDLGATEGFESFLDLTSSFLNSWQLQWHYRSRSEELIAFSNRHIYNNSLITFPGIKNSDVISHVLVPSILGQDGQEESANNEVEKVVEMVLKQATEKPTETLGVITMGSKHAEKIESALEQKLKERPELTQFFNQDNYENFFVKNIERVQGDERDTIILSIGYGKDRSGKLPHRFGPLLYKGGERRLNVASSRARKSMIVVSSFDHYDIDPNRSKARGVELLRLYLQYASSGGKLLGDRGYSEIPLNPFEQDIFDTLTSKNINLIPQFGVSNYRIDMVAQHPEKLGQFVLAIECDGASYHSSPTARERDGLRQQQLESLGWRFHRIWSTDWFNNKEQEIQRTIQAFENAVKYADNYDLSIQNTLEDNKTDNDNIIISPVAKSRSIKPNIPEKSYQLRDAIKIIEWILSDGSLPTDEELLKETRIELGFKRSGKKIDDIIREAIKRVRNQ